MKLKTLKDIDILIMPKHLDSIPSEVVKYYNKLIRAEAIKWVKKLAESELIEDNDKVSWIMMFFNITEEDFPSEKDKKPKSIPSERDKDETLAGKIWSPNNKSKTFIELRNLEPILKEFIKKLKEEVFNTPKFYSRGNDQHVDYYELMELIDKLAGEELTNE